MKSIGIDINGQDIFYLTYKGAETNYMNISNIKIGYTIFVFAALAAFDNIIIGLFPPLFSSIAKEINVPISSLGIVSAAMFSCLFFKFSQV